MFAGWLNLASSLGALLTIGFAIKMMDDTLDAEYDICRGIRTLAAKCGPTALPYCLLAGLMASMFNLHLTVSVFLASYAVGMIGNWRTHLPTRLPAYVESLVAFGLCILIDGFQQTIWAVSMMCVIDWLDDIVDVGKDHESGQQNLAERFGRVEMLCAVLVALSIAALSGAEWTALTFIAFPLLTIFFELTATELIPRDE